MTAAYVDLVELSTRFAAASGQEFTKAAGQVVESYAQEVAQLAESFAPVKTGRLRQSITINKVDQLTAVVGPQVFYGTFMEFGTATRGEFGGSTYEIRPRKPGGYLRFQVGGRVVYTKLVHHPGVPPHPYMRPAVERIVTPFGQSLAELGGSYVVYGPNAPASRPTRSLM